MKNILFLLQNSIIFLILDIIFKINSSSFFFFLLEVIFFLFCSLFSVLVESPLSFSDKFLSNIWLLFPLTSPILLTVKVHFLGFSSSSSSSSSDPFLLSLSLSVVTFFVSVWSFLSSLTFFTSSFGSLISTCDISFFLNFKSFSSIIYFSFFLASLSGFIYVSNISFFFSSRTETKVSMSLI